MNTADLALTLSVALVLLGVGVWLVRERQRDYAPPKHLVPTSIYRILERCRDQLFCRSQDVRLTVFSVEPGESAIRPWARIGWGQPSADSTAEFAVGQGLAGLAIEQPDGILVARFGAFSSLDVARETHREVFRLTDQQALALSTMQLRASVLIASSIMLGRLFKGVLCIDCLDPSLVPMDDDHDFWNEVNRVTASLAAAMPEPFSASVTTKIIASSATKGVQVNEVQLSLALGPIQSSFSIPVEAGMRRATAR